jgi:integrase
MNMLEIPNRKGDKIYYSYDLGGRGSGSRIATGIFTYTKPQNLVQKNHNIEAIKLLAVKKSEAILDRQSIGSRFTPKHKFKENFIDYYREFVKKHACKNNRHLESSFTQFKIFIDKEYISPTDIDEEFCTAFRGYLLDHFTGETPMNYFARFKRVIKAATKAKYFVDNPAEDIKSKTNHSKEIKEILESEEYLLLLSTPCSNQEVGQAFVFCLYTGLRWADVSILNWRDVKGRSLITRLIQTKTGQPVVLTLHATAQQIIEKQREKSTVINRGMIFQLPSANGANKILKKWANDAGIAKKITWSCARLSFSVLLQDKRVDLATIAYLLGHTTTRQVLKTYKRHRPKNQMEVIELLPS